MSGFLQLAFLLSVILLSAKLAGYLSVRLGQPSVLGELLVGILLGPSLIDLLHFSFISQEMAHTISELGEMGVLLLMFLAGMELHIHELRRNLRPSVYAGALGVIAPVLLGWGVGSYFGMDTPAAVFLGLALGATSVSISAQTLIELKALRSRVGLSLLGAAVFDDILVILLLSVFLAGRSEAGSLLGVGLIALRMALFLVFSVSIGIWLLPWLMRRIAPLPVSQGVLTLALVVMLAYGLAAELLGGMAAITGAFLAGLMTARSPEKERIESGLHALAYGLFVPIFFISIGLAVNVRDLPADAYMLALAIIFVGVLGKWLGAGLGARWGGLSARESAQLGAGMVSRGEVGLIVASVGIREGLVTGGEFTAIVAMVLATTILTPPTLRALHPRPAHAQERPESIQAASPPESSNEETS
ncbi:MAG: cation:proton antiporter [Bacteroidota bacterium]